MLVAPPGEQVRVLIVHPTTKHADFVTLQILYTFTTLLPAAHDRPRCREGVITFMDRTITNVTESYLDAGRARGQRWTTVLFHDCQPKYPEHYYVAP